MEIFFQQIQELKLLKKDGCSYSRLSRIFNFSIAYIYAVAKNKLRTGN